jgi:hypothetical protein
MRKTQMATPQLRHPTATPNCNSQLADATTQNESADQPARTMTLQGKSSSENGTGKYLHIKADFFPFSSSHLPSPSSPLYALQITNMPLSTQRTSTPEIPYCRERVRRMFEYWDARGTSGLYDYLLSECTAEWNKKCIMDKQGDQRMLHLMLRLPTELVEALINGTLGIKMMQKSWYEKHFYLPEDTPGVYANVVLIRRGPRKAMWPTTNETKRLITILDKYNYRDKNDQDAIAIDKMFKPTPSIWNINDITVGWRKWIDSKPDPTNNATAPTTNSKSIKCFVQSLQKNRVDLVPADQHGVAQFSAPIEVGWSQNISTRLPNHTEMKSTTALWALVNSALTHMGFKTVIKQVSNLTSTLNHADF